MTNVGFKPKFRLKGLTVFVMTLFITTACFSSCSSSKTLCFYCQERQIEIYVDDQYLGRDLVEYTVSKDREYIEVSCRENGIEVYHKRINVKGYKNNKNTLIELQIPKNYKYNSNPY